MMRQHNPRSQSLSLFFRAFIQTLKDIAQNKSILSTMVISLFFYSFFYPMAYKAQQAEALPVIIVDEEQSLLSSKIIAEVSKSPNVHVTSVMENFADAEQQVKAHQADGILLLPHNLSNSIRRGETGGIGLYLSAANFVVTQKMAIGLASSVENTIAVETEKFSQISPFEPAVSVHQIPLFNTLSGYASYIFPAVVPLIIQQTILLGICMLIVGYRLRAWTPKIPEFFGIFTAILCIGILGCFYLFGFTLWFYEYPHGGNFWGLMLAVPIFVSCTIAFSMWFASLLDLPERAGHILVFTSIPLFMLSGAAWPHEAMPIWMQYMAQALPSTQSIQLFIQLNQMGVPTAVVLPKLGYLLLLTIGFSAWALYRLKYRPIKHT